MILLRTIFLPNWMQCEIVIEQLYNVWNMENTVSSNSICWFGYFSKLKKKLSDFKVVDFLLKPVHMKTTPPQTTKYMSQTKLK